MSWNLASLVPILMMQIITYLLVTSVRFPIFQETRATHTSSGIQHGLLWDGQIVEQSPGTYPFRYESSQKNALQ
jgi:hypothetical protein